MTRGALVVTWGMPRPGREELSQRVLYGTLDFYNALAESGPTEPPRFYINTCGNASDCIGMIVIEGELEELYRLQFDEEHMDTLLRGAAVAENFTTRYMVAEPDSLRQSRRFTTALGTSGPT